MARHNREGEGEDQLGRRYAVSFQPDWFYQVKVTRDLDTGRQSTKTLYRNPETPRTKPGPRVRTRIESVDLGMDFEVALNDPDGVVRRITVETIVPDGEDRGESVAFTISRRQRSRRSAGG